MGVIIGIPPDIDIDDRIEPRTDDENILYLWDYYLKAVMKAGGTPVMLPVTRKRSQVKTMVERCDGFVLPGGAFDIPPGYYGEDEKPWLGHLVPERTSFEAAILKEAMKKDKPVLGICGGMQLMNVALGGTLYQDILKQRPHSLNHEQKETKTKTSHAVTLRPGTRLYSIMSKSRSGKPVKIKVNSTHHQAVKEVGEGLTASGTAEDGIVEGVESLAHSFLIGVQWHPEMLAPRFASHRRLFKALIDAAS